METRQITTASIGGFASCLKQKERSDGTIEKYLHDVKIFCSWQSMHILDLQDGTNCA